MVAGVGVAAIVLYGVNTAVTGWRWPLTIPALALLRLTGTVLLAAALAGWYPARIAATAPITESLKYE